MPLPDDLDERRHVIGQRLDRRELVHGDIGGRRPVEPVLDEAPRLAFVTGRDQLERRLEADVCGQGMDSCAGQLRQLVLEPPDERPLRLERDEVGLREVPVVVGFLLLPARRHRV